MALKLIFNNNYANCLLKSQYTFEKRAVCNLHQWWRTERRLEANANTYGPLTNLPDFTYLDGRATPLLQGQKRRVNKQKEYAQKIVKLTSEVDFAVERYERLVAEKEEEKRKIINSKLRPKGVLLNMIKEKTETEK